eukprot:Seg1237.2 transcript_id=Seg1237.2/GoldUCD/mRNA.D3Y31 product="Nanos 1" protein_id=Seg1237.2/GoldUCD/D3Y31
MTMSDIMQNFMPRNFLDCDDEVESWTTRSGSRGYSHKPLSSDFPFHSSKVDNFSVFQDYFGLSNLLQNVKMSDDNPLLQERQSYSSMFQKSTRRMSWESDASDPSVVISPTVTNAPYSYNGDFPENYQRNQIQEPPFKNLPPPSMRLNKAVRDQIISGSYQNHINNRSDKVMPGIQMPVPPSNPPRPPTNVQVCVFCRNNGESEAVYSSHILKDAEGRTTCPILRAYTCPICKANGDNSHTIKYCPLNQHGGRSQQQSPGPIGSGPGGRVMRPGPGPLQPNNAGKLKPRC